MTKQEYATRQPENEELLSCPCGNTPPEWHRGFVPCDKNGNEVEPTVGGWPNYWYVCTDCGRMIDETTLEVVGRNPHPKYLA